MKNVIQLTSSCPNAFWDGTQTSFCPGLATTDVAVHEWGCLY